MSTKGIASISREIVAWLALFVVLLGAGACSSPPQPTLTPTHPPAPSDTRREGFFHARKDPSMFSLTDCASVSRALSDPDLDLDLRALIGLRAWQLQVEQSRLVGTGFRLVVVQGGDTPDVINSALDFAITGGRAEPAIYDWIEDHGLWFEIAYGSAGEALTRVFVENGPGTELSIHSLCLAHFWPTDEER